MLSDSEQTAVRESIHRVRQSVASHLSVTPGAAAAVGFVANLHRAVDKVAQQASPTPACQPGCAYCCSVRVEATEPEVFRIVGAIRGRSSAEIDALLERLRARVSAATGDRAGCAFLEDNLCSIYEVRPAVCRKAHSLSRERCTELAAEIPQNLELALAAEVLIRGTSEGYRQAGFHAAARELCGAVLLALADETAEARWHGGEAVFPDDRAKASA